MKKKTLKNGVRVITVPQKNTKVATVLVLVKAGSKNEEKSISGISHFLEHMFFKGTKERKTPLAVAEELDKIGGVYNAFTGEDYTGYYAKVNSSFGSLAAEWVADIYLNSTLPAVEVEKEKGVIKEEINMYYDNPMDYCQFVLQNLLYGDQPAGWDIAGTKESVTGITREDLLGYREHHYIAENTVVVVVGDIKKEMEERVEDLFSLVKPGTAKTKQPVVEKQDVGAVRCHYRETDQTHLCFGARAFNIFHENRYPQELLASMLGGMMSSRLFVKIREEMGLAYYVASGVDSNPDTGVLLTRVGVGNNKVEATVQAVFKEYERIKNEKVSGEELRKTKDYLKGKASIYLEASNALASFYGLKELLEQRTYTLEEVFEKIEEVTADDIQQVAQEVFREDRMNIALVGPYKKEEELKKLIRL